MVNAPVPTSFSGALTCVFLSLCLIMFIIIIINKAYLLYISLEEIEFGVLSFGLLEHVVLLLSCLAVFIFREIFAR